MQSILTLGDPPPNIRNFPTSEQWRGFFHRHSRITEVHLESPVITTLVSSLSLPPSQPPNAVICKKSFPLPKLKKLSLDSARVPIRDVAAFKRMVYARSENQRALKELSIKNCQDFCEVDITQLRKNLEEYKTVITWDEKVCRGLEHEYAYDDDGVDEEGYDDEKYDESDEDNRAYPQGNVAFYPYP